MALTATLAKQVSPVLSPDGGVWYFSEDHLSETNSATPLIYGYDYPPYAAFSNTPMLADQEQLLINVIGGSL